jgi:hypothetical protein
MKGGPAPRMRALAKNDRLTLSRAATFLGVRRTKLGGERSSVDPLAVEAGRSEIRWFMFLVLCPSFRARSLVTGLSGWTGGGSFIGLLLHRKPEIRDVIPFIGS